MLKKGYSFYFCTNVPGLNSFDSAQYDTVRSQYFRYKSSNISAKSKQNLKMIKPVYQGPRWVRMMKKLGVENLVGLSL